jgi:hypothetical protein
MGDSQIRAVRHSPPALPANTWENARKLLIPCPSFNLFPPGSTLFPANSYLSIECIRSPLKRILRVERCRAAGPDRPRTVTDRPLRDQPLVERTPERGRDACKQSSLGGFVPPWNRSFSTETADEQPSVWRIMIKTMETDITSPKLPALAEIERRTEELLAMPPPFPACKHRRQRLRGPTPEPLPGQWKPQHCLRSVCDQYALYALAGEAVRTLAPHTEAQPEAILLLWLATFPPGGNLVRIVRTFEPFREHIFLPPHTVLRAVCGDGNPLTNGTSPPLGSLRDGTPLNPLDK